MHELFNQINIFRQWALIRKAPYELGKWLYGDGEWECDYFEWGRIYELFEDFITTSCFKSWDEEIIGDLLYIIARDNEMESLAEKVAEDEDLLLFLSEQSLINSETEYTAKWLLAIQLKECANRQRAEELLELFVQDEDEYVSRRALITLGRINSSKTEKYCEIAWNKIIDNETYEYQRIAVLHALFDIGSELLEKYINLAKIDGRKYLVKNALEIESKMVSDGGNTK